MKHFYAKAAMRVAAPVDATPCLSESFIRDRARTIDHCPTLDYQLGRDTMGRAIARVSFFDDMHVKHCFEMTDGAVQNALMRRELDSFDRKTLTMALHYLRTKEITNTLVHA